MSKNKYLSPGLLIVMIGLFSLSTLWADNYTRSESDKEIILIAGKYRPTKSLFIVPDIRAYINDGMINVVFNETVSTPVSIVIANEEGSVVYSQTIQVDSPMEWPVFINLDDETVYFIEISGGDWIMTGSF